jgi:hypothetical protein
MRHTDPVTRPWRLTWILSLSFWTALGFLCGLQIWIGMLDHGHRLWRVVTYQVLIWNAWFVLTPVIDWLARRIPLVPLTARAIALHAAAALVIAPIHSVWWAMLLVVVQPYDAMATHEFGVAFRGVALSGLTEQIVMYAGLLVAHHAVLYYRKYRDRERTAARLEVSLTEARLHALELQLQPHFLFNTLNSVSALVRTAQQREAVTMIAGLSDLLRYSLDHAGEQRVALATELAITERYLEIERLRFPDRMAFEIDVPAEVRRAAVPTLLLQPLAENAIRHGIARSAGAGRVAIRARRDGAALCIEVFNTGALAADHRAGIGLRNTMDRLRHLYRGDQRFELHAGDGGVVAAVRLPWSEAGGEPPGAPPVAR